MREGDLQTKVLKYLNSLSKCMAENVRGTASQSGRADINACYKGRCIKIELKLNEESYSATKQQKLYLKRWKAAGAIVGVCYTLEDVKKLLEDVDNDDS